MTSNALPPDWKESPLSSLSYRFFSGGTPSTKNPGNWNGEIPWTTSSPIGDDDVRLEQAERYLSREGLENSASNIVPRGCLIVGTRVGVGKAVANCIDVAISQDLTGISLDSKTADAEFIAFQFKTARVQDYLRTRSRGTTIRGISRFDLERMPVYLPPVQQQRAIVKVLRAVERSRLVRQEELSLQRERRDATRKYLMTNGTSREPSRITSLGRLPQSWEVARLAEIADLCSGGTPSSQRHDWWAGVIPWVSTKDLKQPRLSDVPDHITEDAVREGSRLAPAMSLFIGVRGMALAKEIPICLATVPMAFNQDVKAIIPRNGIDSEFLLYALNFYKAALNQHVGTSAHGTRRISSDAVANLEIPIPPSDEQSRIAEILTAQDVVISSLEREQRLLGELFHAMTEELINGTIDVRALNSTQEAHA
jgi:type I restriction enzyme S subunit